MASQIPKIAPKTVVNRQQTPIIVWIRDKLLAIRRDRRTPPPGLPTPDGESRFYEMNRFPNTQSQRTRPNVDLPGGVHHKVSENYYLDRDGRRSVVPPMPIYSTEAEGGVFRDLKGETLSETDAIKVELKNFGLETPTPGFGFRWKRNRSEEQATAKYAKEFAELERYDRYTSSQ